jgi:cystathionine beta-lyase
LYQHRNCCYFCAFETVLKNGDTVLVENDSYGGTYRLLKVLAEKNDIKTIYTDFTNLNLVEEELKNNEIALVLCESQPIQVSKL